MNLEQVLKSVPIGLSAAECASSTVSKYKSSWGSANSFYFLWAVGGGKAIRGIGGGVSFPEVTGARQHVLAFHRAPPATCLSCQWPHWLANSELKPLPLPPAACGQSVQRALKWEIPFGTHLAERSRCTESLIFHDILRTAHVFSFLLLLSSDSGCSCPAPAALADTICVCASHSRRLKTNLACEYEWMYKILCLLNWYCWNMTSAFIWTV